MKFIKLFILLFFIINPSLFGQNQIIKNVNTGGTGWKKVAFSTNPVGRGIFKLFLITKGGSTAPSITSIDWFKGWSNYGGLNLNTNSDRGEWTDARITFDGTQAYLEINFSKNIPELTILLDQTGWSGCDVYSGTLPDSQGDTIIAEAKIGRMNMGSNDLFLGYQGNVGIGTTETGSHKLAVEGTIGAREIKVESNGWSDFVFEDNYQLMQLADLENFILQNRHLPDIPKESEVLTNGIELGKMDSKLLQKIEELTLYTIEQEKKIKELEKKLQTIESKLDQTIFPLK